MKNKALSTKGSPLSVASLNPAAPTLKLLNPKRESLTPAHLKSFPGYAHLSEEEAEEKCASIQTFARLLLAHLGCGENICTIDNQHVISLDNSSESKIVPITKENKKGKAA